MRRFFFFFLINNVVYQKCKGEQHFYEKILGTLIGNPTFAILYWNWDHPDGMKMPAMFQNGQLYDRNHNKNHLPTTLIDFDYCHRVDSTKSRPNNIVQSHHNVPANGV